MFPSLRDSSKSDGDAGPEGPEGRRWFPAANGSAACESDWRQEHRKAKTNGFYDFLVFCLAVISD